MSMNWRGVLAAGAVAGGGLVAACSDSPTGPAPRAALIAKSSFAVGPTNDPTPVATQLKVCKIGDASGTFTVANVEAGIGGTGNPTIYDGDANTTGTQPVTIAPGTVQSPNCVVVAEDFGDASLQKGDFFTLSETAAAGVTKELVSCTINGGANIPCDATFKFFINTAHGYTVLYRNTAPPPPPPPPPALCDFSSFGGFVLSPNNISYGGNAGAIETGQAYGSLNFVNHTTGDQIHVWNVTGYGHPSSGALSGFANSRYASGSGTINGAGSFPVELRFLDNGEPGKNDRVWLSVNGNVLIPEQVVQGGNVQLHDVCKKAPKAEKH
jgi:hypothetical protein